MCVFVQPVHGVSDTRIFARRERESQFLVYRMHVATEDDNAMVLPLPIELPAAKDAVTFLSLEEYETFFEDLEQAFPKPARVGRAGAIAGASVEPTLEVQRVGAFDASFVPGVQDFGRLDARFQLPPDLWSSIPHYRDYGFAVFKLRPGDMDVHPMALKFRSRERDTLFFPTFHIHDRKVEPWARFDHHLYLQGIVDNTDWEASVVPAGKVMSTGRLLTRDRTLGTVLPKQGVSRRGLAGTYENRDVRVKLQNWAIEPE